MPASMNASETPGKEPGRVRPSVSRAEPLSTNASRIDRFSTPQKMSVKPASVRVSQATRIATRPSGEYHASLRSRFAGGNDGRAATRNTRRTARKTPRVTIDTEARGTTTVLIADASATTTSAAPNAIATMRSVMSTRPILAEGGRFPGPLHDVFRQDASRLRPVTSAR